METETNLDFHHVRVIFLVLVGVPNVLACGMGHAALMPDGVTVAQQTLDLFV